jgi:hypothetical protein
VNYVERSTVERSTEIFLRARVWPKAWGSDQIGSAIGTWGGRNRSWVRGPRPYRWSRAGSDCSVSFGGAGGIAPKQGVDQDPEPDPKGIRYPTTELRVSVDQPPLCDLDHAAHMSSPTATGSIPPLRRRISRSAPDHGKQDRECVDEIGGGVELLVRALARRRRTQRVPEREARRDEREQPVPTSMSGDSHLDKVQFFAGT